MTERRTAEAKSVIPVDGRVTAADVARAAGVSRATVSYVLNGKPGSRIPDETAERVRLVAGQLGYTPSAAARALKLGRSDIVLALLPDWPIGHTFGRILELLAIELDGAGLTLMAHPGTHAHHRWSGGRWRGISPVAVITFEPMDDEEIAGVTGQGIALGQWFSVGDAEGTAGPGRPFRGVGRMQVEHLAAAGHRHVGYAYPADPRVEPFAEARLAGARSACEALRLPAPSVRTVDLEVGSASAALLAWRDEEIPVTAVCAYNDETAFALLGGARRLGIDVPDDIAVIGVEDIPTAAFADPPLTTVALDNRQHARFIVASVVASIRGTPPPPPPKRTEHRLIVRQSA